MSKADLLTKIDRQIEFARMDMTEAYERHDLEMYGYWKGWAEALEELRDEIENSEG